MRDGIANAYGMRDGIANAYGMRDGIANAYGMRDGIANAYGMPELRSQYRDRIRELRHLSLRGIQAE